jgi:hypothetical protein
MLSARIVCDLPKESTFTPSEQLICKRALVILDRIVVIEWCAGVKRGDASISAVVVPREDVAAHVRFR